MFIITACLISLAVSSSGETEVKQPKEDLPANGTDTEKRFGFMSFEGPGFSNGFMTLQEPGMHPFVNGFPNPNHPSAWNQPSHNGRKSQKHQHLPPTPRPWNGQNQPIREPWKQEGFNQGSGSNHQPGGHQGTRPGQANGHNRPSRPEGQQFSGNNFGRPENVRPDSQFQRPGNWGVDEQYQPGSGGRPQNSGRPAHQNTNGDYQRPPGRPSWDSQIQPSTDDRPRPFDANPMRPVTENHNEVEPPKPPYIKQQDEQGYVHGPQKRNPHINQGIFHPRPSRNGAVTFPTYSPNDATATTTTPFRRTRRQTTPAMEETTTEMSRCEMNCRTTYEFNPVCGSDGASYSNPGRLKCAQQCGKVVSVNYYGNCRTQSSTSPPLGSDAEMSWLLSRKELLKKKNQADEYENL